MAKWMWGHIGFLLLSLITFVWLFIVLTMVLNNLYTAKSFNSWGDFFAGYFSPLAFAWLAYGIVIQQKEFKAMVKESRRQNDEIEAQYIINKYNRNIKNLEQQLNSFNLDGQNLSIHQIKFIMYNEIDIEMYASIFEKIYKIVVIDKHISNIIIEASEWEFGDVSHELFEEYRLIYDEEVKNAKKIYFAYCFYLYIVNTGMFDEHRYMLNDEIISIISSSVTPSEQEGNVINIISSRIAHFDANLDDLFDRLEHASYISPY